MPLRPPLPTLSAALPPALRRCFVGLALLAVLANALAPALSQALRGPRAAATVWMEVCSADGPTQVRLDPSRSDDRQPAPDAAHDAACGYCLPHAASFALDTPPSAAVPPRAPPTGASRAEAARPRPAAVAQAWARPAPRAPPVGRPAALRRA